MKDEPITGQQIRALAEYVCAIRPEWDLPGVVANLARLGQDVPTTTRKAITAATNPAAHSPAAMLWPEAPPDEAGRGGRPGNQAKCDICARPEWACGRAQTNTRQDPHPYTPTRRATLAPVQHVDLQLRLINE